MYWLKLWRSEQKFLIQVLIFVLFVAIAVTAPLAKQQFITGSIVNTILYLSAAMLGTSAAIMVGMIPSVISLSVGLLPAVLAPMIPFIIISNAILIITFQIIRKKSSALSIVSASLIKYLFLLATSSVVINLLLKKTVASQVALMMSWPQLVTAIIGGILAIIILNFSGKKTKLSNE